MISSCSASRSNRSPSGGERDAVRLVLGLEPARAQPELDAPARHRVDLRHRDRERAGQAERRRRDQRAEPDPRRLPRQRRPASPTSRSGPGSPGRSPIARKWSERKNASKPRVLGGPRDPQLVVVGRALLGLGEDPEVHAAEATVTVRTAGEPTSRRNLVDRDDRTGRTQAAAPRGPQRADPDRAQAASGSAPAPAPARSTPSSRRSCAPAACTRCARRPAAPTSTSAGRTARPPSSSAASSARGAATSARSTPASPPSSTATSRAASPSPCARWACATRRSPASPATTCPTAAPGSTPRPSARSTSSTRAPASSC